MRRVKLTDSDVLEVRRLYATGNVSQKSLVDRYGVSSGTISDIVNNRARIDASPDSEDVIERAGTTWYRRGGRYWYKSPSGSGRSYEPATCAACDSEFFAARSATATQGRFCSIRCSRLGPNNPSWRGDDVGYRGAHVRVGKIRGKASFCTRADETCSGTFHWASLTGNYSDPDDYASMCVSHHHRFDGLAGEGHPAAKLTNAQVAEIRAAYARGGVSKAALGRQYGISATTAGQIIRNEIWTAA